MAKLWQAVSVTRLNPQGAFMSPVDTKEWQDRIERTFNENGIVGPRVRIVVLAEMAYGKYVQEHMRGYVVLADSFQSFYYDTLLAANNQNRRDNVEKDARYHSLYLLSHLTIFRQIRAAETELYHGYPLDGLSLLREIKDRAIFFAAWISGFTNWKSLHATHLMPSENDSSIEASRAWRRGIELEENRILRLMVREGVGFEEPIKTNLQKWEAFFNLELHGSRFTTAVEFGGWARSTKQLSIETVPNQRAIVGYVNRATDVFWMLHRTLPFLQLADSAFGAAWAEKWNVLDISFRQMEEDLSDNGIELPRAVEALIDSKFAFGPTTVYVERDDAV